MITIEGTTLSSYDSCYRHLATVSGCSVTHGVLLESGFFLLLHSFLNAFPLHFLA